MATFAIEFVFLLCIPLSHALFFPIHDESEDKMINPRFHPSDDKACGKFRPAPTGRVFQGLSSYVGQFPWAVCFFKGINIFMEKLIRILSAFRRWTLDQEV